MTPTPSTTTSTPSTTTSFKSGHSIVSKLIQQQCSLYKGNFEFQVSFAKEADLHRHLSACSKNPDHSNFIPVYQFNANHLPDGYHDNDLVNLVRAMSDLTVRITVKYITDSRPETFVGSGKPYPFYNMKGINMMRVGTGWVRRVNMYTADKDNKVDIGCECKDCQSSPAPKTQFAHVGIYTAAHVVYDNLEGAYTTCHLFYDKASVPDACSDTVTITGMSHVESNIVHDRCEMTYITHDLDLAHRLDQMVRLWKHLIMSIADKYYPLKSEQQKEDNSQSETKHTLAIIVSHPHGCSKQVSVGNYIDKGDRQVGLTQYIYDTPTCPGSSGAPVFVLSRDCWDMYDSHVHSGCCVEMHKPLNFSSNGLLINGQDMVKKQQTETKHEMESQTVGQCSYIEMNSKLVCSHE